MHMKIFDWSRWSIESCGIFDFMRRVIELVLALMILPAVFILMLICLIIIVLFDSDPIFYVKTSREKSAHVTQLGRFLSVTSLDELPQIFNIFSGSMTFIGPRPCFTFEFKLIELRENEGIFSMRPGVTGLAQVRGHDRNSERNKVRYESFYLKNLFYSI
jgi:lipopolysaccharide/colanic/teichoic acid biosynthesis glycosyltransferase